MFPTRFECSFQDPFCQYRKSTLKTLNISPKIQNKKFKTKLFGLLHSFRVWFYIFSTRFECSFTSSPLVSSVVFRKYQKQRNKYYFAVLTFDSVETSQFVYSELDGLGNLLHSFRVYFYIFSALFECIFTSSPPVSSVFLGVTICSERLDLRFIPDDLVEFPHSVKLTVVLD
jgi:hypothetical protein